MFEEELDGWKIELSAGHQAERLTKHVCEQFLR